MPWTTEAKLAALLRLPWSIEVERNEEEGYFVARVLEMNDAVGTGETEKALAADVHEAIRESLRARLELGDEIPLPPDCMLPWADGREPRRRSRLVLGGEAWETAANGGSVKRLHLQGA